jgi:hypothetical protein
MVEIGKSGIDSEPKERENQIKDSTNSNPNQLQSKSLGRM